MARAAPSLLWSRAAAIALFAATLGIVASPAHAEPRIASLDLELGPTPRLHVRGADLVDDEVRAALESGARAKVYFWIEVERERSFWLNETLYDARLYRRFRYDSATSQWLVKLERPNPAQMPFSDFEQAVRSLGELSVAIPSGALDPDERYTARVRIECHSLDTTMPFGLHQVLPFLPGWGFDTGWTSRSFP